MKRGDRVRVSPSGDEMAVVAKLAGEDIVGKEGVILNVDEQDHSEYGGTYTVQISDYSPWKIFGEDLELIE